MDRRALASAFNMEGGFNDVSIRLARGVPPESIIDNLDRLIEPYGGLGSVPQALQLSAWTLENELRQLQSMGFFVPAIFLGVAAFILNVALTRALAIQRPQIAALKALGYSNRELGWHYVKFALVIAASGALAGIGLGAWLGAAMMGMYSEFFRFPVFEYRLSTDVAIGALGMSLVVGALGAQSAVRRAVRIPPAEAMRSEPPARYRRSVFERSWRGMRLTMATRMILRNLERQPVRSRDLGRGHRLCGRRVVRRPGVHRRDGRADQQAVHPEHAAGRDGELRRTALFDGGVRGRATCLASSTSKRRGARRCACAPDPRRGRLASPACRPPRASIESSIGGERPCPCPKKGS